MRNIFVLFAAISLALNLAQVLAGNDCYVTEEPWGHAAQICSCQNWHECQLSYDNGIIACKENATVECRAAVKEWARAYREAPNAADPKCHEEDPNYSGSQEAARRC